jgi:hypothetical protein
MVGILIFDFDAKPSTKVEKVPAANWRLDLLCSSRKKSIRRMYLLDES